MEMVEARNEETERKKKATRIYFCSKLSGYYYDYRARQSIKFVRPFIQDES